MSSGFLTILSFGILLLSFSTSQGASSNVAEQILNSANVGQGEKSVATYNPTMFSQEPGGARTYGADVIIEINGRAYINALEADLPDTYPCNYKTVIGNEEGLKALKNVKDYTYDGRKPRSLNDGVYNAISKLNQSGEIWMILSRTTQDGNPDCAENRFQVFLKNGTILNLNYYLPWD